MSDVRLAACILAVKEGSPDWSHSLKNTLENLQGLQQLEQLLSCVPCNVPPLHDILPVARVQKANLLACCC